MNAPVVVQVAKTTTANSSTAKRNRCVVENSHSGIENNSRDFKRQKLHGTVSDGGIGGDSVSLQRRNSLQASMAQHVEHHKRMVKTHSNQLLKYSYIQSQSLNPSNSSIEDVNLTNVDSSTSVGSNVEGIEQPNAVADAISALINIPNPRSELDSHSRMYLPGV